MSYQVLARKWRPRKFSEMVGQEHVKQALINGLDNDRLHHAFLFTGTRGVGKTTIARILAKSLNCERGVSAEPCGECATCVAVDEGRFVDLIEVDAASRTKVDDTRELLDNVQYMPSSGRYKVYLIDEVHMLSTSSFNALLKTLEEPPAHVKFLFATTDPQKVPVTVLSRCLQFNLRRMTEAEILGQLEMILEAEEIAFDHAATLQISRAGDGSMRDALSLLDQAIAFGAGEVRDEAVQQMLGTVDRDVIYQLCDKLVEKNAEGLINLGHEIYNAALPPERILQSLAEIFHIIAVEQSVKGIPVPAHLEPEKIRHYAQHFSSADIQLLYEIATRCSADLHLAPSPRTGLDMSLLRMLAFVPVEANNTSTLIKSTMKAPAGATGKSPAAVAEKAQVKENTRPYDGGNKPHVSHAPAVQAQSAQSGVQQHQQPDRQQPNRQQSVRPAVQNVQQPQVEQQQAPVQQQATATPVSASSDRWVKLIPQLGLRGPAYELARHCVWGEQQGKSLVLFLSPAMSVVKTPSAEKGLFDKVTENLQLSLEIRVQKPQEQTLAETQQQHENSRIKTEQDQLQDDPVAQQLINDMGAQLQPSSIRLNEERND